MFMGFDLGSHASKGVIIDDDGCIRASGVLRHDTDIPNPGWQEQAPAVWWREFRRICGTLLESASVKSSAVRAVGITGFVPGLVMLDEGGSVIRPAVMHTDIRAVTQLNYLNERFDFKITHGYLLPKLMWIRDNENINFRKIYKILVPHGYIVQRLTGKYTCDKDTASVFGGVYDEKACSWSENICSELEVDPGIFPDLYDSYSVVGEITSRASEETGLAAGTPVIAGTGDSFASLLGCGAVLPGDMMIYLGTSGTQIFMGCKLSDITGGQHFGEGKAEFAGRIISCGDSMEHFRKLLKFSDWSVPDSRAFDIEAGSGGVYVFPHLKQKNADEKIDGDLETVFGLESSHTEWHIYRALLEGIAYNLKNSFTEYEPKVKRVIISGGGANSRVFREIIRDVLGRAVLYSPEGSGAAGIALLAAYGTTAGIDLEELSLLKSSSAFISEPDSDKVGKYTVYYDRYVKIRKGIELLYEKT